MEEDAPDVVNAIERDIRVKCLIKIYIYIEVDDYDVNYVRK